MDVYTFHIWELLSSNLWFLMFTTHNLRAVTTNSQCNTLKMIWWNFVLIVLHFFSIYYGWILLAHTECLCYFFVTGVVLISMRHLFLHLCHGLYQLKVITNHAFMVHTFPLLTFPGGLEAVEDVYSLDVIGQRSIGEQGAVPVDCVQGKFKG